MARADATAFCSLLQSLATEYQRLETRCHELALENESLRKGLDPEVSRLHAKTSVTLPRIVVDMALSSRRFSRARAGSAVSVMSQVDDAAFGMGSGSLIQEMDPATDGLVVKAGSFVDSSRSTQSTLQSNVRTSGMAQLTVPQQRYSLTASLVVPDAPISGMSTPVSEGCQDGSCEHSPALSQLPSPAHEVDQMHRPRSMVELTQAVVRKSVTEGRKSVTEGRKSLTEGRKSLAEGQSLAMPTSAFGSKLATTVASSKPMLSSKSSRTMDEMDDQLSLRRNSATDTTVLERWVHLIGKILTTPAFMLAPTYRRGSGNRPVYVLEETWSICDPSAIDGKTSETTMALHHRRLSFDNHSGSNVALRAGDVVQNIDSCMDRMVIRPQSLAWMCWNLLGGVWIAYDTLVIPLLVFELPRSMLMDLVYYLTLLHWTVDLCLNFFVGFNVGGFTELRFTKVSGRYLKTWFGVDLMVLCVDLLVLCWGLRTNQESNAHSWQRMGNLLRMLRFFRLIRLLKMGEISRIFFDSILQSQFAIAVGVLIQRVALIFLVNHYTACLWYGVAAMNNDAVSWVSVMGVEDASHTYHYAMALHWSITQFSPATNNIYPTSLTERSFAIVVVFFALIAFSAFLSSITSVLLQLRTLNEEQHQQEVNLKEFLNSRKVTMKLRDRLWRFFRISSRTMRPRVLEQDIPCLRGFPESMLVELHRQIYYKDIVTSPCFGTLAHIDKLFLEQVCHRAMGESCWVHSQDVFVSGTQSTKAYAVIDGQLKYKSVIGHICLQNVSRYEWVSELSLWFKWVHVGQLVASGTCSVIEVRNEDFRLAARAWGGPMFECLQRFAYYLADFLEDSREPVTDLSIGTSQMKMLAERALKWHEIQSASMLSDSDSRVMVSIAEDGDASPYDSKASD